MNKLKAEKKLAVLAALVEGNSIRSIERMTGVNRNTIMSLLYRVGYGCEKLLHEKMRNLKCKNIQVDEIWCFVGKKQKNLTQIERESRPDLGTQFVFVALDSDTKLIPIFEIGKRDGATATKFMLNLARRLTNHVQITTDAFSSYYDAIDYAFGHGVDYAQLHKRFVSNGERRYSPPTISGVFHLVMLGSPRKKNISTSYVERQNLTMRMQMRRFTRLTNGFSKKLENLRASISLHFANYNFCRIHQTLKCTPAIAAGITNRLWSMEDLLEREMAY